MNTEIILITAGAIVTTTIVAGVARNVFRREFAVSERHAGLLYRHGKFVESIGAGRHVRWGFGWTMFQQDLRQRQAAITGQELLTADNVGIKVSAMVTFQIANAELSVHGVQDFNAHLHAAVQLALRAEVGVVTMEDLLGKRPDLGVKLLAHVAEATAVAGLEVTAVEIRDVMLPGELKKAFTEVLRARKEAEATLERSRGESASLRNLANAARLLENNPALMNLRLLQTMGGQANTYVMGVPTSFAPVGKSKATNPEPEASA